MRSAQGGARRRRASAETGSAGALLFARDPWQPVARNSSGGREFKGDDGRRRRAAVPLDACAAIAMQRGSVQALRDDPDAAHEGSVEAPPRNEGAVELNGFNLHASVAITGDDDLGRERLMRYSARPPLALDRLRRLPDGRITYRIKKLDQRIREIQ